MSAFTNTPPHAVLPLGAYDLEELRRCAVRADQRLLQADLSGCRTKSEVLAEIGRAFALPAHFGGNLDALYDCVTDLKPLPDAEHPGFSTATPRSACSIRWRESPDRPRPLRRRNIVPPANAAMIRGR